MRDYLLWNRSMQHLAWCERCFIYIVWFVQVSVLNLPRVRFLLLDYCVLICKLGRIWMRSVLQKGLDVIIVDSRARFIEKSCSSHEWSANGSVKRTSLINLVSSRHVCSWITNTFEESRNCRKCKYLVRTWKVLYCPPACSDVWFPGFLLLTFHLPTNP